MVKNSTLLPIKNKDGSFQYIDFSHANAYDTLIRPIQTIINAVADGRTDEDGLMIINKSGVAIRMGMDDLRVMGRNTQGVRLINLKNNDEIAAVAKVMMDKEVEEETEETVENIDQETQNQAPLESQEDTLNKNEEE